MRYLVQDTNQGRTSRKMLLFGQGEFLYLKICIGCIPGPDFGALGMYSSYWKVLKGVIQPRTWENGPFGGVWELEHTKKDELSQSKHMGLTIYTKGNINLESYGQDHADVGAKGENPALGPK
jgi:hypothetical protein